MEVLYGKILVVMRNLLHEALDFGKAI
jgi:hypothetical protein